MRKYIINTDKCPNLKIIQISDVHQRRASSIYPRVNNEQPDLVLITGDLFDSYKDSFNNVEELISNIKAPMYYVTGNHENRIQDQYDRIKELLKNYHVTILEDEVVKYLKDNKTINIAGIQDKWFETDGLNKLVIDDNYTILLAHRPEDFKQYVQKGINLVLSGHIHGGMWQLPLIGAVFSPNDEKFFPKYYQGIYQQANTTMIVSTGLGDSFPRFRVNVRCEMVIVNIIEN